MQPASQPTLLGSPQPVVAAPITVPEATKASFPTTPLMIAPTRSGSNWQDSCRCAHHLVAQMDSGRIRCVIRPVAHLIIAFGIVAGAGCGDQSNSYPFTDALGRHCTRTCTGSDCSLACDTAPAPSGGCNNPSAACFTEAFENLPPPAPSARVLYLCAGCCATLGDSGSSSWWLPQDCSAIVCKQDIDCAVGGASCVGGYCEQK